MFKYPQQGVAHTTTLDLNHSNLKDVYEYTVAQSHAKMQVVPLEGWKYITS